MLLSANCSNIDELKIYLPQTAISDGASSAFGFSTMSSINIFCEFQSPGLITPYL